MGRTDTMTFDPALARLHELTDRIRRRAAEERARLAARARAVRAVPYRIQAALPLRMPAPPRHWADGRED
jgi:hypothetical protein